MGLHHLIGFEKRYPKLNQTIDLLGVPIRRASSTGFSPMCHYIHETNSKYRHDKRSVTMPKAPTPHLNGYAYGRSNITCGISCVINSTQLLLSLSVRRAWVSSSHLSLSLLPCDSQSFFLHLPSPSKAPQPNRDPPRSAQLLSAIHTAPCPARAPRAPTYMRSESNTELFGAAYPAALVI